MIEVFTNTSLATGRLCPRKLELGYNFKLELDGADPEALAVGSAWHKAHHWATRDDDEAAAYDALRLYAPGELWNQKLGRLFAAQSALMPKIETIIEPEHTFRVRLEDIELAGQIDGIIELEDGRRGILERKTSGEDISEGAAYWNRLRLDVQVGLYYLAAEAEGWEPQFILYDVVRKPTIRQARPGTKKDMARMLREIDSDGVCVYYGERFSEDEARPAIEREKETVGMFGARLSQDISTRPDFYFQRQPVHRTRDDFIELARDLRAQVEAIKLYDSIGHYPRNPHACDAYGQCAFFALCSNNIHPGGDVPTGYRRREHLHPELVDDEPREA